MRLKCDGKQFECDVCEKLFNNYSVMVVHKRIHFGERPHKCVDCGERFNCSSSLKSHYKLHKQQNLYDYAYGDFATNVPSYRNDESYAEKNSYNLKNYQQTYSGKLFH